MTTLLPVNAVHFGYLSLLPQWLLVKYMMFNIIHHKDLFGVTFRLFNKIIIRWIWVWWHSFLLTLRCWKMSNINVKQRPFCIWLVGLCKFDGVGQDREGLFGWGVVRGLGWGWTISPCGLPPGVLTLILLHVSPISTNGAAIVPPLCAVAPSAQSPWVSKLSSVMFGVLPTARGLHDDCGPHSLTHSQTHSHTLHFVCIKM